MNHVYPVAQSPQPFLPSVLPFFFGCSITFAFLFNFRSPLLFPIRYYDFQFTDKGRGEVAVIWLLCSAYPIVYRLYPFELAARGHNVSSMWLWLRGLGQTPRDSQSDINFHFGPLERQVTVDCGGAAQAPLAP